MEILKSGDVPSLVTNLEVLNILSDTLEKRNQESEESNNDTYDNEKSISQMGTSSTGKAKASDPHLLHRDFIEDNVYQYLSESACGTDCINDMEQLSKLVTKLKKKPKPKPAPTQKERQPELALKMEDQDNEINGNGVNTNGFHHHDEGEMAGNYDDNIPMGQEQNYGYGLTDSEVLQIMNHMPREQVEIHLFVEDLPNRLEEDKINELLELVSEYRKEESDMNQHDVMGEEEEEEDHYQEEDVIT